MSCISDEILRAGIDTQLSEAGMAEVERHLASCADCHRRAEDMRRQAARVRDLFSTLAPTPAEATAEARVALARFRADHPSEQERAPSWLSKVFARRLRPAWAALALAAVAVVLVGFAPARSWAQKILAMFRVQKIAVVTLNPDLVTGQNTDNRSAKMLGQLLSDNLVVSMDPGPPRPVAGVEQASQLAGFGVRLLSSRPEAPQLQISGEGAFHMTLNLERLQAILDEAGRSDLQLPASLDGATIAVHIPRLVLERYGNCPGESTADTAKGSPPPDYSNCVFLAQVLSPTVSVPPDLNIAQIAEAALQLGGMSAQDAHAFCQAVDWTSTLVIPLPRQGATYQKVEVDGVEGTLIDLPKFGRRPQPVYSLLWVKNGVIYCLTGFGTSENALPLAASLN